MTEKPDPTEAAPSDAPVDGEEAEQSTVSARIAAAASKSGLGQLAPGEAPSATVLLAAIGGVRGLVEAILPGVTFLVVFTVTGEVAPSVIAPVVFSVVFVVLRLLRRQIITSAVAGAVGVAISAVVALSSGRAEDNFLPGFVINVVTLVVLGASMVARWPAIGVIVGSLSGDIAGWRRNRAQLRVAYLATFLWAGLAAARLAVQVPLWAAGETSALAIAKLVMGVPLYGSLLWFTWLLVRSAWTRPATE